MIIDITQELFSCLVYPGDPQPEKEALLRLDRGDICNLTGFSMCAHNGTHVDAPFHFLQDGKSVDQMGLTPYVGPCWVARHEGHVSARDARDMLAQARAHGAGKRLLIAGNAAVTEEAARAFAEGGLLLLGNESQTVGPQDAPRAVHLILLSAEMTLLEGVVLDGVAPGRYFLSAAPLNLGGCDGAPCRAYLITEDPMGNEENA